MPIPRTMFDLAVRDVLDPGRSLNRRVAAFFVAFERAESVPARVLAEILAVEPELVRQVEQVGSVWFEKHVYSVSPEGWLIYEMPWDCPDRASIVDYLQTLGDRTRSGFSGTGSLWTAACCASMR